jgi:hypothetical protein
MLSAMSLPKEVLKAVVGLAVALAIAEGTCWVRDGGAFPHLNVYQSDPELGTRLKPGASQRLGYSDNPITSVAIGPHGFRGPDWGPTAPGEIIALGDSQVFGLGVEEDQTFSAMLSKELGVPVRNAGVPTYGPDEYTAVLREILTERQPAAVIYTVNILNDLFEADRPNRDRHAVWDGWAVRLETAPDQVTEFPGRSWLYRESHFVFALRWLWSELDGKLANPALASEGTWTDLVGAGDASLQARATADEARSEQVAERQAALADADEKIRQANRELDHQIIAESNVVWDSGLSVQIRSGAARPGDIVQNWGIEGARPIELTAAQIQKGAKYRRKAEQEVRRRGSAKARGILLARDAAQAEHLRAQAAGLAPVQIASPVRRQLEEVAEICEKAGIRLVVAVLPIDVQVDPKEWDKYDAQPRDMSGTEILARDVLDDARSLGVDFIDLTAPLAAVSPGAFLNQDIHMTPKGHAAVAAALADLLSSPPPLPVPQAGLPEGRSPTPDRWEWLHEPENRVRGSTRAGCSTHQIREWLRIVCLPKSGSTPVAIRVTQGQESQTTVTPDAATLVVPLLPGQPLSATFTWSDRSQVLTAQWQADTVDLAFGEDLPAEPASHEPADLAYCESFKTLAGSSDCTELLGAPNAHCAETYGASGVPFHACTRGDPLYSARCPQGWAPAGAIGLCRALCSAEQTCSQGNCATWMNAQVCL